MEMKKSKVKKILIMFLIITLIIISYSFLKFNGHQISNGRKVKLEQLVAKEYVSNNNNYYVNFIAEDLMYIKFFNKESEETITATKNFTLNDGLIETIDQERFVLIGNSKIAYLNYDVILYLKIE